MNADKQISLIVPGTVNREDVADGADFARRARVMLYAIDAAKTSRNIVNKRASRPNALGVYPQRKEVRKTYTDHETGKKFEVVVRADNNGEVYEVFDIFPR